MHMPVAYVQASRKTVSMHARKKHTTSSLETLSDIACQTCPHNLHSSLQSFPVIPYQWLPYITNRFSLAIVNMPLLVSRMQASYKALIRLSGYPMQFDAQ